MIRKIIILALVIAGAILFYKKFMADTFEPFFKTHTGKVDFLGTALPDLKNQKE